MYLSFHMNIVIVDYDKKKILWHPRHIRVPLTIRPDSDAFLPSSSAYLPPLLKEFPILSKKYFQQNTTTLNICWNTIWLLIFVIYKKWQKYMTKLENLTHYPPQSPLPSETWLLDHLSSDKSLPFTFDVSIYSYSTF